MDARPRSRAPADGSEADRSVNPARTRTVPPRSGGASGAPEDLAALYDAWAGRLLGYMIALTRDRHAAEDALQNLFVKLAASRPAMDDPAAYLFGAARNEALRASRRRPERSLAELDVVAPRATGADPDEARALAAALDRLPAEQAEVVILHAFEGLTFAEVGRVTGVSLDTAASRWRYALEKLRGELGGRDA